MNEAREPLVPLRDAIRFIPDTDEGRRPTLSTVTRWITRGVAGVRLDAVRVGGRWLVSREAIRRFLERVAAQANREEAVA